MILKGLTRYSQRSCNVGASLTIHYEVKNLCLAPRDAPLNIGLR
jgi:hypothetical protein